MGSAGGVSARAGRLRDLYGPMLTTLWELLGVTDQRIKAAACSIIAAHYGRDPRVHEADNSGTDFARWLTDEEMAQVQMLIDRAEARRAAGEPEFSDSVIDGQIMQ